MWKEGSVNLLQKTMFQREKPERWGWREVAKFGMMHGVLFLHSLYIYSLSRDFRGNRCTSVPLWCYSYVCITHSWETRLKSDSKNWDLNFSFEMYCWDPQWKTETKDNLMSKSLACVSQFSVALISKSLGCVSQFIVAISDLAASSILIGIWW